MNYRTLALASVAIIQCFSINAQTAATGQTTATPYTVVGLGANYQVLQRVSSQTNQFGKVIGHTNSYTELATGMHYQKNGQWVNSQEKINLLPGGGAAATNGQHQIYFPVDIYNGLIEIVTPDGKQLYERPLGISYFDGTNSVMFALLTNSVGQILPSGNQVIYTNAFTGVAADLVCTYRKAGFECDLVFRQQPTAPDQFGLNSADSRLELMTEFINSPDPDNVSQTVNPANGLVDQTLDFGGLEMIPGKAFLTGGSQDSSQTLRVCKQWTQIDGRTFLIEELPYSQIETELQTLPAPTTFVTVSAKSNRLHLASVKRLLPASRPVLASRGSVQLASVNWNRKAGVVLDYNTVITGQSNYTFQADTTYCISGYVGLYGNTTFEGGTVVKYTATNSASLDILGTVDCETGPYRPAIFTAVDDNSVGDQISGSTGTPSGYYGEYGWMLLNYSTSLLLHDLRMSYLSTAFYIQNWEPLQFLNLEVVHSGTVFNFYIDFYPLQVENGLFSDINKLLVCNGNDDQNFIGNNLTVDNCTNFWPDGTSTCNANMTNSLLANASTYAEVESFYTNAVIFTNDPGIFQTVGAGNYYLATNSPYRGAGTTNIDPVLLAALQTKTTYPPTVLSNITVSVNTTLSPQVQRDTSATPDLGFHYDPIDYITDIYAITNAALTITNGVAIACYDETGIWLHDGSSIVSVGTPQNPNWFIRYQSVQEQPVTLGPYGPSAGLSVNQYHVGSGGQTAYFRFSNFSCPAGGGIQFENEQVNWLYTSLWVQDCHVWGGNNNLDGSGSCVAVFDNNLFFRSAITADGYYLVYSNSTLAFSNNLFYGASSVSMGEFTTNDWMLVFNNDFDSSSVGSKSTCSNGYNAYLNCTGRLSPTNVNDVVLSNSLAYEIGPLGNFYQPTNSSLINAGSTTANLVGLFHYTTQTNQILEANSQVDIGFHYIAVDANGNPIDTTGDGIPDYVADQNGNGVLDPGEVPFGITIETPVSGAAIY